MRTNVYAQLLDDGQYLCSSRTMYRVYAYGKVWRGTSAIVIG